MSETAQTPLLDYHLRTRHRFEAYAEGPGLLDWDAQPAAFRHYPDTPLLPLPLSAEQFERPYGQLHLPLKNAASANLNSLGALLECALGLSAWKSWGPNRWAVRCNPSSGNLHPVEAYVLSDGLSDLPPGLHHYDPEHHALEGRALLAAPGPRPWLVIGLSSVMWREAWKYGERAFRYCQLDVGHAIGALSYSAALLGWRIRPLPASSAQITSTLGIDRPEFPAGRYAFTETEEPEILLALDAPGLSGTPDALDDCLAKAHWYGKPSLIDPSPSYRWPVIEQAALASRSLAVSPAVTVNFPAYPALPAHATPQGAASLIRQRRSAQRFDPHFQLSRVAFYRLLDATLPRPHPPWDGLESAPRIHLLLFVLRVEGLPAGLYLLPRSPQAASSLPGELHQERFARRRPVSIIDPDCPPHLALECLAELEIPELQRLARSLSCHQDIAATSSFSLGMIADLPAATVDGYTYRGLLREAGLIGQSLYLEAEAAGVRGTGIGCFFDAPVQDAFGLSTGPWQPVYHFTVGLPVIDPRIETAPPYPQRLTESP